MSNAPSLLTTEATDVADFALRAWNHDESQVKREEFSRSLAADAAQDIKSVRTKLSDTMIHLSRNYQHGSIDWVSITTMNDSIIVLLLIVYERLYAALTHFCLPNKMYSSMTRYWLRVSMRDNLWAKKFLLAS